ncbi:hypothetical protein [Micromonospora aurantiaca (nom. illeg.)]|uniref:hypothetical protein n=1 Tax=Micromonospora aurantiaca (nom. illeg.) TaxID=47850 RepID=UPI003F4A398F
MTTTINAATVMALAVAMLRHDHHSASRHAVDLVGDDTTRIVILAWCVGMWNRAGEAHHGTRAWRCKLVTAIIDAYLPTP